MSDTKKKTFVNGLWVKKYTFSDGNYILKLSCSAEKMSKFLLDNKNDKGYTNIVLSAKREVGEDGISHVATLDEWKPKSDSAAPQRTTTKSPSKVIEEPYNDDVDF